jgi:DNA processing protein
MQLENRDLMIAYSLLPFLNPARTRLLREQFDSLTAISAVSPRFLEALLSVTPEQAEVVKNPLTIIDRQRIEELRESAIVSGDEAYPPLLSEIADPPLALHPDGNRELLATPMVAVVGSRRASAYGINAARHLASALAGAGITVVSGLALGIDAAAHEAALDAGGQTLAVLGTGIDLTYPRSNARLRRRIAAGGLVLSEFPHGTPPLPENFPMRNRVISGLALGAVIVEATSRSGSLITARMAAEQGREVFAVPGPIFSAGSEGTHRLIQYGAKLVHDIDDILEELPGEFRARRAARPDPPAELSGVLNVLTRDEALHIETIAGRLSRSPSEIFEALLQLELGGWVRSLPGTRFVRNAD